MKIQDILGRESEAKEVVKDHKYGGSWSTHWFWLEFSVPESWKQQILINPKNRKIHLIWDSGCEATLYSSTGKMLQAFTENQRQEFDLDYTQLTSLAVNGKIKVLVEMACNETFGNFEDGFMTKTVYDKEFKIKKC